MDNGIDRTVGSLKNGFVYYQARCDPLSLCSTPPFFSLKKLRAVKRNPWGLRAMRKQMVGSRGVLIKLMV